MEWLIHEWMQVHETAVNVGLGLGIVCLIGFFIWDTWGRG